MYINFVDDHVKEVLSGLHTPIPETRDYQSCDIFMGTAFVDKTEEALLSEKLEGCDFARWHPEGVNILRKGGSKKEGIRKFMEVYDLKREEIMAVGDGDNDFEMIEYAGTGVAMGNGTDLAKKAADYITSDIDSEGIKNALEHFTLI